MKRCRSNVALATALIALGVVLPLMPAASESFPPRSADASQKNGRIAYTVFRYFNPGDDNDFHNFVRTVRPDGSGSRTLPCATPFGDRGCEDFDPAYSNDGHRLATSGFNGGGLVIRSPAGRILRRLDADGGPVAWSPGRRYLALTGFPLRIVDLRTDRVRRLGGDASDGVSWSPRGTLIYEGDGEGFVTRKPSGRRQRILRRVPAYFPVEWAPGGRRFAYACDDGGVCAANPDGTRRRLLTTRCSTGLFDRFAWSPDGREIACGSRSGLPARQTGLIAINVRSKRLRVVVRGAVNIGAIDWQPLPRR